MEKIFKTINEQIEILKHRGLKVENEEYAQEIYTALLANNIRAELDIRSEKLGYKIREASTQKIPYQIIVGDEEQANKKISIRGRNQENASGLLLEDFISRLKQEVSTKKM